MVLVHADAVEAERARIFEHVHIGVVDLMRLCGVEQARIDIDEPLILKTDEQADFILLDVPSCKGWGYSAETLRGQKKE